MKRRLFILSSALLSALPSVAIAKSNHRVILDIDCNDPLSRNALIVLENDKQKRVHYAHSYSCNIPGSPPSHFRGQLVKRFSSMDYKNHPCIARFKSKTDGMKYLNIVERQSRKNFKDFKEFTSILIRWSDGEISCCGVPGKWTAQLGYAVF